MKLRAPATPLITIDPYFSIWSAQDTLNAGETIHWTGKPNAITGILKTDGEEYLFMGYEENMKKMVQTDCKITAMSTVYTFTAEQIELTLTFTSPLLLDDLKIMSRPVSYLQAEIRG
ncbi:MAG TPA: glutaminase, partial [Lachnospiraceae bacterium]|nr:glutaminase [Lachnospiraceae bacterium]